MQYALVGLLLASASTVLSSPLYHHHNYNAPTAMIITTADNKKFDDHSFKQGSVYGTDTKNAGIGKTLLLRLVSGGVRCQAYTDAGGSTKLGDEFVFQHDVTFKTLTEVGSVCCDKDSADFATKCRDRFGKQQKRNDHPAAQMTVSLQIDRPGGLSTKADVKVNGKAVKLSDAQPLDGSKATGAKLLNHDNVQCQAFADEAATQLVGAAGKFITEDEEKFDGTKDIKAVKCTKKPMIVSLEIDGPSGRSTKADIKVNGKAVKLSDAKPLDGTKATSAKLLNLKNDDVHCQAFADEAATQLVGTAGKFITKDGETFDGTKDIKAVKCTKNNMVRIQIDGPSERATQGEVELNGKAFLLKNAKNGVLDGTQATSAVVQDRTDVQCQAFADEAATQLIGDANKFFTTNEEKFTAGKDIKAVKCTKTGEVHSS